MLAENASGFSVEAKDEPHAKFVQADEGAGVIGFDILGVESVIEFADNLASFE